MPQDLAEKLAANGPLAVALTKKLIRERRWADADETAATFRSADALEGARAFADRRPPAWTGKQDNNQIRPIERTLDDSGGQTCSRYRASPSSRLSRRSRRRSAPVIWATSARASSRSTIASAATSPAATTRSSTG